VAANQGEHTPHGPAGDFAYAARAFNHITCLGLLDQELLECQVIVVTVGDVVQIIYLFIIEKTAS
jgi:hypothetical protein